MRSCEPYGRSPKVPVRFPGRTAEQMKRTELQPRRGGGIRQFLHYYVLVLLRKEHLSPEQIIRKIRKESAENRDFRASGPLLVAREDLDRVMRQLSSQELIRPVGTKWRITLKGIRRCARYRQQKKEQSHGKDRAARKLLRLMGPCKPQRRVLDVGTGEGYLAFQVADKGCRVLGIDSGSFDYSKDSISNAREKAQAKSGRVEFLRTSVTGFGRRNRRFDYVVSSHAIHCMRDQRRCLRAVYRLLKPKGVFLCMDFQVDLKGFLRHGWHGFLALSEEEWRAILPGCGFDPPEIHKVGGYLVLRAQKPT